MKMQRSCQRCSSGGEDVGGGYQVPLTSWGSGGGSETVCGGGCGEDGGGASASGTDGSGGGGDKC